MREMSQENKPLQSKSTISACDIMKNNTSKIIRKMESQIPSYVQLYSDYYKEYLHSLDDIFGTCYIAQKEFFDKMAVDKNTLSLFDNYWNGLTKFYSSQIEMSTNFVRAFIKTRISAIKSWDQYVHFMMDSYARSLSKFNNTLQK